MNAVLEVVEVVAVTSHPNADSLTLNALSNGATCISNLDNGNPRFKVGHLALHVTAGVVPDWVKEYYGLPNNELTERKMRGIVSQGVIIAGMNHLHYENDGTGGPALILEIEGKSRILRKGDKL